MCGIWCGVGISELPLAKDWEDTQDCILGAKEVGRFATGVALCSYLIMILSTETNSVLLAGN